MHLRPTWREFQIGATAEYMCERFWTLPSLRAARQWVHGFVQWYNGEHRHSSIRYVTPNQRHEREDTALLANRKSVYEAAKARNPSRWSGATRNWEPVAEVWLNPPKDPAEQCSAMTKVA